MTAKEANIKAKMIHEEWKKKRDNIEIKAKETGIWKPGGLDTNTHLFKKVDDEAKREIELLKSKITEK